MTFLNDFHWLLGATTPVNNEHHTNISAGIFRGRYETNEIDQLTNNQFPS